MAPTLDPTTTSKKRLSCDRCHGQKLRCIRTSNNDPDACNRCLRQGAQCVYSSSLPKGRPNMYRLADASTAPPKVPTITPVAPEPRRHHPFNSHTATADAAGNADAHSDTNGKGNTNPNVNEDLVWDPWLEPLDWNDMQVDEGEQDLSRWTSNSQTSADPQLDAGAAFLDAFPSLQGWPSIGESDGDRSTQGAPSSPTRLHQQRHGLGNALFGGSSSSSSTNMDKNGPDIGIARLSQLSTRLYPLHRSSCSLAEKAGSSSRPRDDSQIHQVPRLDGAAFKSVAAWLVHVSADMDLLFRTDHRNPAPETTTTGDTLQDAFSASQNLLEIMRYLQADAATGTSSSTTSSSANSGSTGGAHVDLWASIALHSSQKISISEENSSYCKQRKGSSSYARPSSQYSNTVIRHLVSACHTLLLNIYVAVLIALQHDADRWNFSHPPGNVKAKAGVDPAVLADMGLVMAVQLSSYLIGRQHQAVDLYLSPQAMPPSSQQHEQELSGSPRESQPPSTTGSGELMSDLKMEVQQRLARLRQTLRI